VYSTCVKENNNYKKSKQTKKKTIIFSTFVIMTAVNNIYTLLRIYAAHNNNRTVNRSSTCIHCSKTSLK